MNYGVASTSASSWASGTSSQNIRFDRGLRLHGYHNGVKAVLWHQGEEDSYELTKTPNTTAFSAGLSREIQ